MRRGAPSHLIGHRSCPPEVRKVQRHAARSQLWGKAVKRAPADEQTIIQRVYEQIPEVFSESVLYISASSRALYSLLHRVGPLNELLSRRVFASELPQSRLLPLWPLSGLSISSKPLFSPLGFLPLSRVIALWELFQLCSFIIRALNSFILSLTTP